MARMCILKHQRFFCQTDLLSRALSQLTKMHSAASRPERPHKVQSVPACLVFRTPGLKGFGAPVDCCPRSCEPQLVSGANQEAQRLVFRLLPGPPGPRNTVIDRLGRLGF